MRACPRTPTAWLTLTRTCPTMPSTRSASTASPRSGSGARAGAATPRNTRWVGRPLVAGGDGDGESALGLCAQHSTSVGFGVGGEAAGASGARAQGWRWCESWCGIATKHKAGGGPHGARGKVREREPPLGFGSRVSWSGGCSGCVPTQGRWVNLITVTACRSLLPVITVAGV